MANYLTSVTDQTLRKTLTMYRLSDHRLAIETGRHRQTWQPREDRLCQLCPQRQVETETHFLLKCGVYEDLRTKFFSKIEDFDSLSDQEKMCTVLGENSASAAEAAIYVRACHSLRETHLNTVSL